MEARTRANLQILCREVYASNTGGMSTKKSKLMNIRRSMDKISHAASVVAEDRVSVYAAQASFFIVISAIPFIMLLFSLSGYVISDSVYDFISSFGSSLPGQVGALFRDILSELAERPAIKLISVTAVTTFWTASRGISAVRGGVATVYKSEPGGGFIRSIVVSLIYTAVFIALLVAMLVLVLFGQQLYSILVDHFEWLMRFKDFFKYRTLLIFIFLTFFFCFLYYAVNRHGFSVERSFKFHLPGAIVAASGWMLFSYFYSLYTVYFSRVSYIYGSLAAIVLLMLWMYFCMMILLFGAEFNKLCAIRRKREVTAEKIRKAKTLQK